MTQSVLINKCLFPVAGSGSRFLPVTKSLPKEMLPIVNKPLLQYGVEEALSAGMADINIVSNPDKQSIEHYFSSNKALDDLLKKSNKTTPIQPLNQLIAGCSFNYRYQHQPKGLGDAILCGQQLIGDEPFAVILPDDLCIGDGCKSVLEQMVDVYQQYRVSVVAVEEVATADVNKYGIIEGDAIGDNCYQVHNMMEKPAADETPSRLAIIGRYILTPDIFQYITNTKAGALGEIQITDALLAQAKLGNVIAYQFNGSRYDCGSIDGFVAATNYFYQQQKR